ncbi:hypothetical protein KVV02_000138 [Mortierella alpina]|uniref:Uncharacterized protein n=1 Tax=Mortierella alpina TaxID=64518 RepID=A0A9P8CY95_MORAP|nr:hypothetical protein KVV02_000138 [Mortierella alpina]
MLINHRTPSWGRTPMALVLSTLSVIATMAPTALAQSDPIIEHCATTGCSAVTTMLGPCGGGASDAALQHDAVYTVTPLLGSCQCNSQFFNAFSSCLACIATQGKSLPSIDNQQNWVRDCTAYGFNFTDAPVPYKAPINGGESSGGLGKGAIIGIVVAVVVVAGLAGAFMYLRTRKRRTKAGIFERPYTSASSGHGGSYAPTPTQPTFNTNSHYQSADYPNNQGGFSDQDHDQQYYNYSQNDQQYHYGSDQNMDDNGGDSNAMMMSNMQRSSYIPPPVPMSPTAVAAVGTLGTLGSPRPSDQYPQSLRSKHNDWEGRQHEFTSDLVSTDQLLHNDKAVYEDDDDLEPPRARDRYVNDRDDFTSRRSLTPPRANMQSYRDEFTRPSYDREGRRNSGSDRGSVSGANAVRGAGGVASPVGGGAGGSTGYDSNDDNNPPEGSPENSRRRRAAELFSAEGTRR